MVDGHKNYTWQKGRKEKRGEGKGKEGGRKEEGEGVGREVKEEVSESTLIGGISGILYCDGLCHSEL